MRPDCPECGEPMGKPFKSCKCGWRAVPAKRDGNPYAHGLKVGDHWVDKTCKWNDHGDQCQRYGCLSVGTTGEGPWYCRDHFADLMKWPRIALPKTNLPIERAA